MILLSHGLLIARAAGSMAQGYLAQLWGEVARHLEDGKPSPLSPYRALFLPPQVHHPGEPAITLPGVAAASHIYAVMA